MNKKKNLCSFGFIQIWNFMWIKYFYLSTHVQVNGRDSILMLNIIFIYIYEWMQAYIYANLYFFFFFLFSISMPYSLKNILLIWKKCTWYLEELSLLKKNILKVTICLLVHSLCISLNTIHYYYTESFPLWIFFTKKIYCHTIIGFSIDILIGFILYY